MTKFFKSTLSFGILIVAVLTVQNFILTRNINPFWGRKKLVASMDSLKSRNSYDMIFIGSSLTYRQINPTIIDSLLDIRSFNLGFPSMRNPELWYVVDHFIQEIPTSQRPKYLVIELSKIHEINSKNLNSVWSSYFLDYQRVRISTKYFSEKKDFTSVKNYFYDFLKNQIFIGIIPDQIRANRKRSTKKIKKWSGYYPLDFERSHTYKKRRKRFLKNPKKLSELKMKIRKEHRENKPQFSKHDLEIYERISRQCKENNITPIYVYPPKKHRLLGLFKKLPDVNKIDLSDPRKYPEFYSIKNSFDKKHFNGAGATLYSVELAKKLAEIIE